MDSDSPPQQSQGDGATAALNLKGLRPEDYLKAEAQLSVEQKSALAAYLAAALDTDPAQSGNAEAILRLIIWNADPQVIEAMARAAAGNPHTPHSLAWALANDDESAAVPILRAAIALADSDLVAIVEETQSFSKMAAVACRSSVSATVSRSLAIHGDEATMVALLNNAKAEIPDDAFGTMLDRQGQHETIQKGIICRAAISPSIVDRLLGLVSTQLASELALRHQAPKAPPADPKLDAATSGPVGYMDEPSIEDMEQLVADMVVEKSITVTLLMRKLCRGNFEFFCRALAAMADVPNGEIRALVLDAPAVHLPKFWAKASLPAAWSPVACAAASALIHIDKYYSKADPLLFRKNIVDRTQALLKAEKHTLTDQQKSFFRSL